VRRAAPSLRAPHGGTSRQRAGPVYAGGGMMGGALNSGFGRAMEMGAGIGLGEDLINGIL
jgi:hypothetical protein